MSLDSVAIVVMSKFPEPGRVKTRLQPVLSAEQAAGVHQTFLLHLAGRLSRLQPAQLLICHDPPEAGPAMRDLLEPVCPANLMPQDGDDLGRRLAAAAERVGKDHPRRLFLGTDSPDIPDAHLRRAARLMEVADVTLGPTDDGGYWSLGLSGDVDGHALLGDIPWSSGREAARTLDRARALGYATELADAWDDVDHPADLRRLIRRLAGSSEAEDRKLLEALSAIGVLSALNL